MRRLIVHLAALAVAALLTFGAVGALGTAPTDAHAASAPPPPTPTPTYHPTLQLSAAQGTRDQALIIVASGFPPTGQVTVYWDGAYLARGTTDDAGYVALRTAVPHDAPDGPHEVRAVGPAHTSAGAAFTVAAPPAATYHPALAVSPAQGLPADRLVALASGFPPGGALTLSWDGATLGHATADDSGAARLDAAIPPTGAGASAGPHELRVVGPAHTTASAPVAVLDPAQVYHPALALDVAHGAVGAHVSLAATGFAPDQDVRFYWDRIGGPDLGAAHTDTGGTADHTITIGQGVSVTDGAHRLYAAGSNPTLATSAFFTVDPPPPACRGWFEVPIPFSSPFCFDPIGWFASWLTSGVTAGADAIGRQVTQGLTAQKDYTQIPELQGVFTTTQQLARDLFLVLFVAGALTWYARRLGLGPGGEAATQMVEGGLGLALTTALPGLMHLYIVAVNGVSGQILADSDQQGATIAAALVGRLVDPALVADIVANPMLGAAIGLAILAFFVVLILVVVTRIIGTIYGAAIYLAAPLCAICMVTPLTRSVAVAWARLWFSITTWGVSYAIALVAIRAMVTALARGGGLQSLAEAMAGILVLYGAPRLGDAVLGGGASRALGIGHAPLASNAVNTVVGAAFGGAIGAIGGAAKGADAVMPATPGDPSVVQMPNASVTELSPAAAIAAPITAEWGLIE